jgi:hypothetical protein
MYASLSFPSVCDRLFFFFSSVLVSTRLRVRQPRHDGVVDASLVLSLSLSLSLSLMPLFCVCALTLCKVE